MRGGCNERRVYWEAGVIGAGVIYVFVSVCVCMCVCFYDFAWVINLTKSRIWGQF